MEPAVFSRAPHCRRGQAVHLIRDEVSINLRNVRAHVPRYSQSTRFRMGSALSALQDSLWPRGSWPSSGPCYATPKTMTGAFSSQAGQDSFVLRDILLRCDRGFFVEFGARNGVEHSNTHFFEGRLGWKGLLFEASPTEFRHLRTNRPGATVYEGAVCPRWQHNLTFGRSSIPGWGGAVGTYEPSRKRQAIAQTIVVRCYHLAHELRRHHVVTVDYMTIDTEGREFDIIEDFPWKEFEVKVVQIEQLDERRYPAQKGRRDRIRRFMVSQGYTLLNTYTVAQVDTEDLIFVLNGRRSHLEALVNASRAEEQDAPTLRLPVPGSNTVVLPTRPGQPVASRSRGNG